MIDYSLLWVERKGVRGVMIVDPANANLAIRLVRLRQEHADLAAAIDALAETPASDQLRMARMKKRKLLVKDEIAQIEDMLLPDIIA